PSHEVESDDVQVKDNLIVETMLLGAKRLHW
ncbi:hypothetical protein A2U01_0066988, partial [Trifolium medium]|nr:hypothetical protein [Trifolium medium]